MTDIKQLYDDVMLDHIRNARNYRVIDEADCTAREFNPLCGDELTLYLKLEEKTIMDIAFQCSCCGIAMASASIMTEAVKGKNEAQARALAAEFRGNLEWISGAEASPESIAVAVLSAVRDFPSRVDCATLAWSALLAALNAC
jgi:nitrogen fixation protein NifU and related proteins